MPHLPKQLGSFPLILRDYNVGNPKRGELLLNYENNELYFVRKSDGSIISVARNIYDKILNAKIRNSKIYVESAEGYDKETIIPPVSIREYNGIYFIVTKRRLYTPDESNPLTAPSWAVKSGKKYMGKSSGYNPDADEEV